MIPIDRPLVVTDTETTGINPAGNRLIEIGAMRLLHDEEPINFSRLIDPGESIPYRITRLTGITSSMVFGCPDASEVLPAFEEFLGDGILVAHNLAFDRGFLNAERDRLGLRPIHNRGLCTARLARRLLPGLRSKGLDSLSRFFRIAAYGRHRALRDVEITVEVLKRLMAIAHREHHVDTIDELLEMQTRTYSRINPFSRHIIEIRKEILPEVPDSPGVYKMLDGRARVLYVGKAKVLSNRVRSYFNAIEAHTPRVRRLVSKLRDLEWTRTDTELEALLLESKLIRELEPPFNRAQRRTIPRPYLRIASDHAFPRIVANVFPREDGAEYFGPLRSRGEAQAVLEVIGRFYRVRTCDDREFKNGKRCLRADVGKCNAPCEGDIEIGAYAEEIDRVREFLAGDVAAITEQLESEMHDASAELAFEEAARIRDLLNAIEMRMVKGGNIAARIFEDDAVVLHTDPDAGIRDILIIRSGRFAVSLRGYVPDSPDSIATLGKLLDQAFDTRRTPHQEPLQSGANQIRVLLQWLYANRENILRFDRDQNVDPGAFLEQINDAARIFFSKKRHSEVS